MKQLLLFMLLVAFLPAKELQKVYFVSSNDVNLSVITHDKKNDKTIFHIQRNRYLLRVPTKKVLHVLQQNGYHHFTKRYSYVNFIKQSNLDTTALQNDLREYFVQHYQKIAIKKITIIAKKELSSLPKRYTLKFQKNTALLSHGNFSIITPQKEQIFFEYYIEAIIPVYIAKKKIKKGELLSLQNTKIKSVVFNRFRSLPIQSLQNIEAKYHIMPGRIITIRDVTTKHLVKRGDKVVVVLQDKTLEIDFTAKALQGGSLHDIILIQLPRGKKLRAKVIGKNLVEVEAVR